MMVLQGTKEGGELMMVLQGTKEGGTDDGTARDERRRKLMMVLQGTKEG